ncbi:MAG: mevalonate kinase [Caldilineaceae bacterium]
MNTTTATAPGKIILVGEHAVVYGRPAIAVPVWEQVAQATIAPGAAGAGCTIVAPDINRRIVLAAAGADEPLAVVTRLTLAQLQVAENPDWQIEVRSQLPVASGLGSGAALSAALVRAIYSHCDHVIDVAQVSTLVYASERLYHGTPSGIDNTVIAYGMPVWFVKGQPPIIFTPGHSFTLAIADSGIRAPTKESVADVRRAWQRDPAQYEAWFDEIGALVQQARSAIEQGDLAELGQLFNQNHALLSKLDVSNAAIDRLVSAARQAGAWGAKVSGGGRGGNVIALIDPLHAAAITAALQAAGARNVIITTVAA